MVEKTPDAILEGTPASIPSEITSHDSSSPNQDDVPSPILDTAGVFGPAALEAIERECASFEVEVGCEIVILTLKELPVGYEDSRSAASDLLDTCSDGPNKGILFLMVMPEGRLEIELGSGLNGILSETWLSTMKQRDIIPHFTEKRFDTGIIAGVKELKRFLKVRAT